MASGVRAANRATGSRTSPFKSSAFICHPWFLPTIHIPNHGPPGVDGRLEDESLLFPIRTEKNETGTGTGGCSSEGGISMLIHNFLTFADHRVCEMLRGDEEEEEEKRRRRRRNAEKKRNAKE